MKKLDGAQLGNKKLLNKNCLFFKKIALFQQKITYIAEEVSDYQISNTQLFIFNKKNRLFLTQKMLILYETASF